MALFVTVTPTLAAEGEQEMHYLFAGMLQERSKLKSWSCTVTGVDLQNRSFDMKLLWSGESFRFDRTRHVPAFDGEGMRGVDKNGRLIKTGKVVHLPAHNDVERACDNKQMTVFWDVTNRSSNITRSTPSQRELLHIWDPRTACLILVSEPADYRKALNDRLKFWKDSFTIERKGALWTGTFTRSEKWQDSRLSITVDTEHGFTPVSYRGDTLYKPNSRFPGKVEVCYEATAEWKQLDGVWVPIHHRHVRGDGTLEAEYKLSWDWVNKDVDDKEFTLDGLGVPADVPKIYFDDKGREIPKAASLTPQWSVDSQRTTWVRRIIVGLGLALIALALLHYRLRRKPANPGQSNR
jgi:hypothetical protein